MSSRREFLKQASIVALGAVVAAPLLARMSRPVRGVSLIAWVNGLRAEHEHTRFLAGSDVIEFLRQHHIDSIRYTERTNRTNFSSYEIVRVPVRHTREKYIVNPFFTECVKVSPTEWRFQNKRNPYWSAAPLELVWAFGGSTVYACVIDRETMEIDHKPEFILNPAWQTSEPEEVQIFV